MLTPSRPGRAVVCGALFFFAFLWFFAAAAPATAQTDRYAEKTAERLAELGIDQSQVRSIRYALKRRAGDRGPSIAGAKAWIRLTGCSGYLIVDMNRVAYILQTYTEGDCRVEGVKAF